MIRSLRNTNIKSEIIKLYYLGYVEQYPGLEPNITSDPVERKLLYTIIKKKLRDKMPLERQKHDMIYLLHLYDGNQSDISKIYDEIINQ